MMHVRSSARLRHHLPTGNALVNGNVTVGPAGEVKVKGNGVVTGTIGKAAAPFACDLGNGPAATALLRKPADFTDPEHSSYYSDRGRIYIITNGIPESPMAGWKDRMTDEEIRAVYSYIVTLRKADEDNDHEEHDHAEHGHRE